MHGQHASALLAITACLLNKNKGSGSNTNDSALALLATPCLLMQQWSCLLNNNNGGVLYELQEAPASKYI
jgi:hypothetical protein